MNPTRESNFRIEGLTDIKGYNLKSLSDSIKTYEPAFISGQRKTYLKVYQGIIRANPQQIQITINLRNTKIVVICFYKLVKRNKNSKLDFLNNTASYWKRNFKRVIDFKLYTTTLERAKYIMEKISNHLKKNNNVATDFLDGAALVLKNNMRNDNSLIRNSHVITVNPLSIRPNGLSETKTGFMTMDQIFLIISKLPLRERAIISNYYHPFNPYTWNKEVMETSAAHDGRFPADLNPYICYTEGDHYLKKYDDMKSHELLQTCIKENPNIFGSLEVMGKQSNKLDKRTVTNPTEFTSFLNAVTDTIPIDEFGFPIELEPPELNVEIICANGPISTTGGVDIKGTRQTKTNLYHDSVDEALNIAQACKNRALELNRSPDIKHKEVTNKIYMQPLFTSVKNELVKRGKKVRFFTLIPSPFEILENIVYSQILDNNKGVTYDQNGGNRLMIGTSLDRGYGTYLLQCMVKRNGEDLEGLLRELKERCGDFSGLRDHQNGETPLEKSKGFVTDYTSQEFQHNLVHRALSQLASYHFYTYESGKSGFQMVMAVLGELTLLVDADLGTGKLLLMPPGHVGSGCKLTLLGNGNSNKFELSHACMEGILSIQRGYYYRPDLSEEAYSRMKTKEWSPKEHYQKIDVDEKYDNRTIMNMHSNTVFQGDDGYLATMDGCVKTFQFIINIMSETYSNIIKPEVKNLFAVHDDRGYDIRDAADFLKIKPTLTKKGIFFIRDTAAALQKMFIPSSYPFNAITQIYAAISQSYTSAGNYYSYKLAMYKCKMLTAMVAKHGLTVSDDDNNNMVAMLQRKSEVKSSGAIDTLLTDGFNELDFSTINENFLKPDNNLILKKQHETAYYNTNNLSKSMLMNMGMTLMSE